MQTGYITIKINSYMHCKKSVNDEKYIICLPAESTDRSLTDCTINIVKLKIKFII